MGEVVGGVGEMVAGSGVVGCWSEGLFPEI